MDRLIDRDREREGALVGSKQRNYFENATACRKRTLKMTVATQLYYTNPQRCHGPIKKRQKTATNTVFIFLHQIDFSG